MPDNKEVKLKTLKDVEMENSPSPADEVFYFCNDLRDAAREWIKWLDKEGNYPESKVWIRHFFNLENDKKKEVKKLYGL